MRLDVLPRVTPSFVDRREQAPRPVQTNPVQVLLEESDPFLRSKAHYTLGVRANARQDLETALDHFQEAADLDPTDERPRSMLRNLSAATERAPRRGLLGRLKAWRNR